MQRIDISKIPEDLKKVKELKEFRKQLWKIYALLPEVNKFMMIKTGVPNSQNIIKAKKAELKAMFKKAASVAFDEINEIGNDSQNKSIIIGVAMELESNSKQKKGVRKKKTKKGRKGKKKAKKKTKKGKVKSKKGKRKPKKGKRKAEKDLILLQQEKRKMEKESHWRDLRTSAQFFEANIQKPSLVLKHLHDVDNKVKQSIEMEAEFYENADELREWEEWRGNYNQKQYREELEKLFQEELFRDGSLNKNSVPKISQELKDEWLEKMKKEQNIRFAVHRMEWDCAFNKKLNDDKKTYSRALKVLPQPDTQVTWKWTPCLFTMKPNSKAIAPDYRVPYEHQKWALKYGKDQKARRLQSKIFGYKSAQMKARQYLLKNALEKVLVEKMSKHKFDDLGLEKRIVYKTKFHESCLETSKSLLSWNYAERAYRIVARKRGEEEAKKAKKKKGKPMKKKKKAMKKKKKRK
jgi:hypothetical protein